MNTVIMPKQGLQMTEGTIMKWLVAEGNMAVLGEPLFEMETDKLTITIMSPYSGVLRKIIVGEGDTAPITAPVALIGGANEPIPTEVKVNIPDDITPVADNHIQTAVKNGLLPDKHIAKPDKLLSTPRARMRAKESGIDIADIIGSGPDGLIIERDILTFDAKTKEAVKLERIIKCFDYSNALNLNGIAGDILLGKAVCAATILKPEFTDIPKCVETVFIQGVDGFDAAKDGLLTLTVSGNNARLAYTYSDKINRDIAVQFICFIAKLLSEPLIMLSV